MDETRLSSYQHGEVLLEAGIKEHEPPSDQLESLIEYLTGMEQAGRIRLAGNNELYLATPSHTGWYSGRLYVNGHRRLYHVSSQQYDSLDPGDFFVSPGLGNCQAVSLEGEGGQLHFLHNYAWGHFDVPRIFAWDVSSRAEPDGGKISGARVLARNPDDILRIANDLVEVLKLSPSSVQVGVIPSSRYDGTFTVRVWGHGDSGGKFAYRITSDTETNAPISVTVMPLTDFIP